MKKLLVVLLVVAGLFSCKKEKETQVGVETAAVEESKVEGNKKICFTVEGMTCEVGCANMIQSKLKGTEGVVCAKVDYETKKAKVKFDSTVVSTEELVMIVEGVADGTIYKVSDVKLASECKKASKCCEGECKCDGACKKDGSCCKDKDADCAKKCADKNAACTKSKEACEKGAKCCKGGGECTKKCDKSKSHCTKKKEEVAE